MYQDFSQPMTPSMVLASITTIVLWKGAPNSAVHVLVGLQYMWGFIIASLVLALFYGFSCCARKAAHHIKRSVGQQPVKYTPLKTEEEEIEL
jgi:hypothetical protein